VHVTAGPSTLAHDGSHLQPAELWTAWNADPLVILAMLGLAWAYERGRSRNPHDVPWRARCFWGGFAALVVALLSPLDALSDALASAHMVQHLLLTLVAAPLLVLSAPGARLMRGSPAAVRSRITPWRRRLRSASWLPLLRSPATAWMLFVATFWAWHAAVLYDAALENAFVHALEHATFLGTGVLVWRTVIGVRAARVPAGLGVLVVFGLSMSSALLSLLLTFAGTPWYEGYAATTHTWGLEHLADQQLAGAIMWIPAGLLHLVVAIGLLVTWIRSAGDDPVDGPVPGMPTSVSGMTSGGIPRELSGGRRPRGR
jgi:putative membrane protein